MLPQPPHSPSPSMIGNSGRKAVPAVSNTDDLNPRDAWPTSWKAQGLGSRLDLRINCRQLHNNQNQGTCLGAFCQ